MPGVVPFDCFGGFCWFAKETRSARRKGRKVIIPVLVVLVAAGSENSRRRCWGFALVVADGIIQDAKSSQRLCLYKLVSFVLSPH